MSSIQITDSRIIEILANNVNGLDIIRRVLENLSEQNVTFQNSDISALMMKLSSTQKINFRTLFIDIMQYWISRAASSASINRLHDVLKEMQLQNLADTVIQIKSNNSKWWLDVAEVLGGNTDLTANHETWKDLAVRLGLENDIPHLNTVNEINFQSFWIATLTKFRARTSNSLDRIGALLRTLQSVGLMDPYNKIQQLVDVEADMELDELDGYSQSQLN